MELKVDGPAVGLLNSETEVFECVVVVLPVIDDLRSRAGLEDGFDLVELAIVAEREPHVGVGAVNDTECDEGSR